MTANALLFENEIRSPIRADGKLAFDDLQNQRNIEDAVLRGMDFKPLWSSHILTRRRPDIHQLARVLFEATDEHVILPHDDVVFVARVSLDLDIEICAIVTVEPVYVSGTIGYWMRSSIYEGGVRTATLVGLLRAACSLFEILDYPDAEILGSISYSYLSPLAINAYAAHEERSQTLFLVPTSTMDTKLKNSVRHQLIVALMPYGIFGQLSPEQIEHISGIKLSNKVCAVAIPPRSSKLKSAIVLEPTTALTGKSINWCGMADYLGEIGEPLVPWHSEGYVMRQANTFAVKHIRLVSSHGKNGRFTLRPLILSEAHAELLKTITETPGWDLYSPLPLSSTTDLAPEARATPSHDADFGNEVDISACVETIAEDYAADTFETNDDAAPNYSHPRTLSEIATWASMALSTSLIIAPRAIREIKRIRHPQPERIADALKLLAGPRLALFRGDRSSAQAFHEGLIAVRMRDGFSGAERLVGRTGSDYLLSHDGRTHILDRHLASNSSGFNDPKMIRIYYCYDRTIDKIVVGWLPTHLQTSKT